MAGGVSLSLLLVVFLQQTSADEAYRALREKRYDEATRAFRTALSAAPGSSSLHKDLAYTLLKVGENEEARDEFRAAMGLDTKDWVSALEYAFLCNETKRQAEARRVFDRLRREATGKARSTAERAFETIDGPLRQNIARWQEVVTAAPGNDSAHEELARLAETRDELPLALQHYEAAMKLRPDRPSLALDVGRVLLALGEGARAQGVLTRAAQSRDARTAELAREFLPEGASFGIRAEENLECGKAAPSAKQMGIASLNRSFLVDAQKYLEQAQREDPNDAQVMLKLGQVHNLLGQDEIAVEWFRQARRTTDPTIRQEASRAYNNLRARRIRTTAWVFPVYSSRWSSLFLYGQAKVEMDFKKFPVKPYISARVMGDLGLSNSNDPISSGGMFGPVPLSERSIIPALGISAPLGHKVWVWGEAGSSIGFSGPASGHVTPDYRGGVFTTRGWGAHLGSEEGGWFAEVDLDVVYLSRYEHDVIAVVQNRTGYTSPPVARLGGLQWQLLLHTNFNVDANRQYWANFLEMGPGYRFRWAWMPANLYFGAQTLLGNYTVMEGNPRGPRYRDLRVGLWYAFTR